MTIPIEPAPANFIKQNLDNSRFMSYMPAWSSANQNHFSNTAKTLAPMLESYSSMIGDLGEKMVNNIQDGDFGWATNYYYYQGPPNWNFPATITTEQGVVSYIGEQGISFMGDYVATQATTTPIIYPVFKESLTVPCVLFGESYIFVGCTLASIQNPVLVTIYGTNDQGTESSEQITLISNGYYVTINKYRAITRLLSDIPVTITSYLDTESNFSYNPVFGPQKRTTRPDGTYFQPIFEIDQSYLLVLDSNTIGNEQMFRFKLNRVPDHLFVSTLLDVYYTSAGNLYVTKLHLDYVGKSQYNSTYNNNDFIFVGDPNQEEGAPTHLTINSPLLSTVYGGYKFRIKTVTSSGFGYIDLSGNTTDENTWFDVTTYSKTSIIINKVFGNVDTTFVLQIYNGNQDYCAGFYFNTLPDYQIATGVSDMFFKNRNLYINQNDVISTITPVRPYYTSAGLFNSIALVFSQDYQTLTF